MDSRCSVALYPNLDKHDRHSSGFWTYEPSMDTSNTGAAAADLAGLLESWGAVMNFVNSYEMFKGMATVASFNQEAMYALISAQLADATMSTAQSQLAAMAAAFPMHAALEASIALPLSPTTYPINILSLMGAADLSTTVNGNIDFARLMGNISNSHQHVQDLMSSVGPFESPNSIQAPTPNNITPPDGSPNLPDALERNTSLSLSSLAASMDASHMTTPLSPDSMPASQQPEPVVHRRRRRRKQGDQLNNGEPPVHRIRRRKTRNGSIPEEDDIPLPRTPRSVAPPGCRKQSESRTSTRASTPTPTSPMSEEQQMNTPDDPVIHSSPPSIRLNPQGGNNAAFQQIGLMQCPPNGLGLMSGSSMPPSNSSTDSLMQNGPGSQEDANRPRRTKTCRVCGDHATGYNFNVITCESCKAFFRRNALRPKLQTDFKCPYSDDCEINAVSRRFCQKCRLKKCFDVGMKKEWILNEEQLRRRKNSRLNSKGGSMRSPGGSSNPSSVGSSSGGMAPYSPASHSSSHHQQQQAISRNSAIVESVTNNIRNEALNLGRLNAFSMRSSSDITSPPSIASSTTTLSQQMLSPMNSMTSMSTSLSNTNTTAQPSPTVPMPREPILLHDIVAAYLRQQNPNFILAPSPTASQTVRLLAYSNRLFPPQIQQQLRCGERVRIEITVTDYALLISATGLNSFTELPGTADLLLPDEAYEKMSNMIKDHVQRAIQRSVQQQQAQQQQQQAQQLAATSQNNSYNDYNNGQCQVRTTSMLPNTPQYDDISSYNMGPPPQIHPDSMSPESRNRYFFIENAITTYLNAPPEEIPVNAYNDLTPLSEQQQESNSQSNVYMLNETELHELDNVRVAFMVMDEPLTDSHAASYLMKNEHAPGDIMNIMDVTIRRIVKTAKRLDYFNEISNDGKLQLLKSSMIDMLTIRGVVLLDEQMKNWNTPILGGSTKVSMDMFDKLTNPEQRQRFIAFCTAIHPEMRKNPMAIMLIALVVLFDNSRAAVLGENDQEVVRRYHELYYHLLQRYLESVYNERAPQMIKTIPRALRQLARINETSVNLFAGRVDTKTVAQLPTEFFKTEENQSRYNQSPPSQGTYGSSNPQSGGDVKPDPGH